MLPLSREATLDGEDPVVIEGNDAVVTGGGGDVSK